MDTRRELRARVERVAARDVPIVNRPIFASHVRFETIDIVDVDEVGAREIRVTLLFVPGEHGHAGSVVVARKLVERA